RNVFKKGTWRPVPSGDGQKLSVRYQTNGKYYNSENISFTEPWFGGKKPNNFSVSGYHTVQSNGRPVEDLLRSSISITGGSVGYGRRLKWTDDYFTVFVEGDYQYYELKNYSAGFLFSNGYANNPFLEGTFSRNSIDQPIYPRTGSQTSLSAQF